MHLEHTLTIVVACKNEQDYIHYLLGDLKKQQIGKTKILIADASTDNTRSVIEAHKGNLNVEIIDGGPVSIARNNGARLATTPLILFIDSDVRFFSDFVIRDAVKVMLQEDLDLVGLNLKCYDGDIRTQISFSLFNAVNHILKYWSPFAVGAFLLTRKNKFDQYGGFDENLLMSEDFFLSKEYTPHKFRICNHFVGQDSRRFRQMGYWGMAWLLVKNFWHRNNPDYWNRVDHSYYWNK